MYTLTFFTDEDEDFQVAVFAIDEIRAIEIWEAIDERTSLLPDGWSGLVADDWYEHGLVRHEYEARSLMTEGIGAYSAQNGWKILPIDYAAIGIDPPADVRL